MNIINFNDPAIIAGAFLAGAFCVGVLVIVVVIPLIGQFSLTLEAVALMMEGIGEYFGQPRLAWIACGVVVLGCLGCCAITIVLGGAAITCSTATPSQICRFIGR